MFGGAAPFETPWQEQSETIRMVLWRGEETGFGIQIAEDEERNVVVTGVQSTHARQAGAEAGAVLLRVAGYDVERRGLEAVHQAVALSPSSHEVEFVMRLGGALPAEVTGEQVHAATVLQSRFRGYRERQKLQQQQYDEARSHQMEQTGGLWGAVQYEWGKDEHDVLLERLEAMEHGIQSASTDLSLARHRGGARSRERVPLAVGRSGSSAYLDSRTALWSRPNAALTPSRSDLRASDHQPEVSRRPGEFQPGLLMSAWDQSRVTNSRRRGLQAPSRSGTADQAATVETKGSDRGVDVARGKHSSRQPGHPSKLSSHAASDSPRRSLSKSLAATLGGSREDGLKVGRQTFV